MANKDKQPTSKLDRLNLILGVVAVVLLTASLALGYLPASVKLPEWVGAALRYGGYGAMALYVATLLWLSRGTLKGVAKHRHAGAGANATVQIAAVAAILVAANWWGTRHHARFDVTENKQYSLSEQSKKIVKNLKEPVSVTLFVKNGEPYSDNLKNLWQEYAYAGGDNVKLTVVDIDRDPFRARQMEITTVGSTVLQRGERKTTITGTQEQDLTAGLLKVTQAGQKVIYFLTGHGELSPTEAGREGLSMAKDALEKQNYKVDQLGLFGRADVPADADLVVVAGPTKPLLPKEVEALDRYIKQGGHVFLSLHPQTDPRLEDFTRRYGIGIDDNVVLDPTLNMGNLASPAVKQFPPHPITQGLQAAFFPGSRSLTKLEKSPAGVTVTPLVESSADAWGETNLVARPVSFDAGKDKKGPLPLVLMAEQDAGSLIVSGNSLFMSNEGYQALNNGDLFLNALNALADEESLIAIAPKPESSRTITMLPWQQNAIFFGSVVGLPLGLLLAGAFMWWRRR